MTKAELEVAFQRSHPEAKKELLWLAAPFPASSNFLHLLSSPGWVENQRQFQDRLSTARAEPWFGKLARFPAGREGWGDDFVG